MKKFEKILGVIITILILCLLIAYVVLWLINKSLALEWFESAKELLARPIVVAGVSTTIGGLFIYIITRYIVSNLSFGKNKIAQYEDKVKEIEKAKNDFENKANEKIEQLTNENQKIKGFLYDICKLSTNQKIKNYGKELLGYGKETINSETKAD